ncbi:Hypothetical predicted protein [Pelobates cultripes]|uniref:L1 transposable element dsRBD-like domain-containing protein n=1 Tax=Pelobates cultripes TaxID=61616 RepID=A0AAD1SP42_PELCU|nr:Hypothetical predicted protein [Pelobates cultripes]
MRASRTPGMPNEYSSIKIFADLSADTLQFRKSMAPITSTLREHNLNYRWGFPAKLLISHQGAIHAIMTLQQGAQKLGDWGLPNRRQSQLKQECPGCRQKDCSSPGTRVNIL